MAVQSIIDQTYTNLEILITDDCSTDATYNALREMAKKDNRIALFKNEKNVKLPKTLNAMIERSKGKYIARMDADDISLPERLEKQVAWMETHADYAICGTNAWYITKNCKKVRGTHIPSTNEEISRAKYFKSPFIHPSVLVRKEIFDSYKYDEKYHLIEDYELWFRILNKNKGHNLEEKLLLYRVLPSSITNTKSSEANKLLVKMFSENLTNQDEQLAEEYVYSFLNNRKNKKLNTHDAINDLILNLISSVRNCSGFNFYVLLRCFRFYVNNKNMRFFLQHLPTKAIILFPIRLAVYIFEYVMILVKRKIFGLNVYRTI